jgi:endonuclease/exonuclease/phosphatase (EEP) superfamily protein YafD
VEVGELGGSGIAARYDIETPSGLVHVVNLHLETPRKGLEPLRGTGDPHVLAANTELRDLGSHRIRGWVDGIQGPLVVAGDFNTPVESAIYREHWGDLVNAFSAVGSGFGGSRMMGRYTTRIDHILLGPGWRPLRSELGPDLGSDHLPMIADVRREKGP